MRLLKGLYIVPGGPEFGMAIAMLFKLPDLHEITDAEDVVYQNAANILRACAHHDHAEDFVLDDAASAVDSIAHSARQRDIFGSDHEARRTYRRLAHFLSGGDGGMPHPDMENWIAMDCPSRS